MNKSSQILTIIFLLHFSTTLFAKNHTITIGYEWDKITKLNDLVMKGGNVKYRYEWNSPISVIGSLSYKKGSSSMDQEQYPYALKSHVNIRALSLSAGPAWRLNNHISVFGLLGGNMSKVEFKSSLYDNSSAPATYLFSENETTRGTNLLYGWGVQANPINNIAIDFEMNRVKNPDYKIINYNIAVGYSF